MNIIEQIPINVQFACENLSCMINFKDKIKLVNQWGMELCSIKDGKETKRIHLSRPYDRLVYCVQTEGYFAICQRNPECVFVLNKDCQETDCLKFCSNELCVPIKDIWYNSQSHLIWLVTSDHIYIINCNGDLLNTFMTAPMGTKYKAVCTYKDFVFIAFSKENCLYLASYTKDGAYIEKIKIGHGYTMRNLQPVICENETFLNILVLKDYRFPEIIKIQLDNINSPCFQQLDNIIVEYNTEPDEFCLTCNVELFNNMNIK